MSDAAAAPESTPLPHWVPAIVVLGLLPFAGKALHIDDPLFVWSAQQILASPLDFYSFEANWYGTSEAMAEINKNPPGVAYYLAAVGFVFGFSEVALHLGMLLPAMLCLYGVAALARQCGTDPVIASLAAIATPAFVMASSTLMSDVLMLTLGIWGVVITWRAIEAERFIQAAVGGGLLGFAVLTKYFALAFLPLVVLIALGRRRGRRSGRGFAALAIALAVASTLTVAFDFAYAALYDIHPIADVAGYAAGAATPIHGGWMQRAAVGLFFLGGCTLGPALLTPWLWSRRALAMLLFGGGLVAALAVHAVSDITKGLDLAVHQAVFAWVAVQWLALAGVEAWRQRDAASLLCFAWIVGVFVFASFTNWTTNGRSILPAVPALGVLIARALQRRGRIEPSRLVPAIAAAFLLAFAVAWGDARLADSARAAARHFGERYVTAPETVRFQGSWGFQYYMEAAGLAKFEPGQDGFEPGDRLIVPGNNTNLLRVPEARVGEPQIEVFEKSDWISLLARRRGAGYHASIWGALPYSFGPSVPARYAVYTFERSWSPRFRTAGEPASEASE